MLELLNKPAGQALTKWESEQMAGSEILNAKQAAAFLGVHPQTIRKMARSGQIPCFKMGTDWRFRKEALVQWADAQHRADGDPTNGCSVLIIDDEEEICAALTRMVERLGCRARHATDGQVGLDLVARDTPDIILLDLKMPNMNGPQFLAKLRETHKEIPVAIVTGYPDGELMKQATQYAPLMLVDKPVEPELLERTIRTALGGKMTASRTGT